MCWSISRPDPFLEAHRRPSHAGGRLLLATPNLRRTPATSSSPTIAADFDEDSLAYVVSKAGLGIELLSTTMLPKELVAVLSLGRPARVRMLAGVEADARQASTKERCSVLFRAARRGAPGRQGLRQGERPFGIMGIVDRGLLDDARAREQGAIFSSTRIKNRVGHQLTDLPILSPLARCRRGRLCSFRCRWQWSRSSRTAGRGTCRLSLRPRTNPGSIAGTRWQRRATAVTHFMT